MRKANGEGGSEAPTTTMPTDEEDARLARLERLASMHEKGILTDEEFATEKRRVLGGDAKEA